jgi:NAD(P)-dependent dehydrogenase (short-subunit alcohol dehydrogenase family)
VPSLVAGGTVLRVCGSATSTANNALGVRILSVHADAGDPQALDAFYDEVEAGFGAIDIVVNVVAGVKRSLFMNTTREDNVRDNRLNYGYVIDSCRRAIPLIRKGGN